MTQRYVLSDKARKDVMCRVPRLLHDGKIDAAGRCLAKHGSPDSSPLLLALAIEQRLVAGDAAAAGDLYASRDSTLRHAKLTGPDEVTEFFVQLFAFHLSRDDLPSAEAVYRDGQLYEVDKSAYGLLWAKYCDAAGRLDEGLACLDATLPPGKRFTPSEREFLAARYPALAGDTRFDAVLDRRPRS